MRQVCQMVGHSYNASNVHDHTVVIPGAGPQLHNFIITMLLMRGNSPMAFYVMKPTGVCPGILAMEHGPVHTTLQSALDETEEVIYDVTEELLKKTGIKASEVGCSVSYAICFVYSSYSHPRDVKDSLLIVLPLMGFLWSWLLVACQYEQTRQDPYNLLVCYL